MIDFDQLDEVARDFALRIDARRNQLPPVVQPKVETEIVRSIEVRPVQRVENKEISTTDPNSNGIGANVNTP